MTENPTNRIDENNEKENTMKLQSITNDIIAYEQGELDKDETIELFQTLISTGVAWSLQGSYGRTATQLIEAGYCHHTEQLTV